MFDFDQLIIKKLSGNITPEEEDALNTWLKESENNRGQFRRIKATWEISGGGEPALPDIDDEWRELQQRLKLGRSNGSVDSEELDRQATIRKLHGRRAPRTMIYGAMAAVLLAVAGLVTFWGPLTQGEFKEVVTANAQRNVVNLPDGSIVRLNHASSIRFKRDFNGATRQVELHGEAYFEVVSGTTPFVVVTDNARVQVLGTAFNVWCRSAETRVMVREGEVSLKPAQEDPSVAGEIVLSQNQSGKIAGILAPELTAPQTTTIPWLEDRIVFNETRLVEVAEELERIYDENIRLADPVLSKLSISGTFEKKNLDAILSAISLALDIDYQQESGAHVLKPR